MIRSKHQFESRTSLSDERLIELLAPFGVHPSSSQIVQVRQYLGLLLKWNETVGLTTIADPEEIVSRHFGESMFLASVIRIQKGRLADLGSGAGFPGLALKLIVPDIHVILIESNKKKCAFLQEVVRTLNLSNAEAVSSRFEDIRETENFADVITVRALGDFRTVLRWSRNSLSREGCLALWVGQTDSTAISQEPGWMWQPAVHIPESQRRFLLLGTPNKGKS